MSWDPQAPGPDPEPHIDYGKYHEQPPGPHDNHYQQDLYQQPDHQQQQQYQYNQPQPPYGAYNQPQNLYQQGQPGYIPPQPQQPYGGGMYQQGQPGFQQPFAQGISPDAFGPSSIGMTGNIAAGLSYFFSPLLGLIFFLIEKQNRFVRFHAFQGMLMGFVALGAAIIFNFIGIIFFPLECVGLMFDLAFFVFWLIALINAFQGKIYKIPVIGDYAMRTAYNKPF